MSRATRFGLLVVTIVVLDVALVLAYPGHANVTPAGFAVRCALYVAWGFAATRTPPHLLSTPWLGVLAAMLAFAVTDAVILIAGLTSRRGPAPAAALAVAGFAIPIGGSVAGGLAALLRRRPPADPHPRVDG
ncbi:MAG TPA: hypothetical protein VF541_14585 [Longimicrobium sp.]|jgi:hypothetical protein